MEFSKPIWAVNRELASEVGRILNFATNPEQCARMFAELDSTHSDIHELIDRHQSATGNDRYNCMLSTYAFHAKARIPRGFYRSPCKSDSSKCRFDVNELKQADEKQEEYRPYFHR